MTIMQSPMTDSYRFVHVGRPSPELSTEQLLAESGARQAQCQADRDGVPICVYIGVRERDGQLAVWVRREDMGPPDNAHGVRRFRTVQPSTD